MDKYQKKHLDELINIIITHTDNINTHTDKVGQSIMDEFSRRCGTLELDLNSTKNDIPGNNSLTFFTQP